MLTLVVENSEEQRLIKVANEAMEVAKSLLGDTSSKKVMSINSSEYLTPKNDIVECIIEKRLFENGKNEKVSDRRSAALGKARLTNHKKVSLFFLDEKYRYVDTKTNNVDVDVELDTYRNIQYGDYYLMLPKNSKDMTGVFNIIFFAKKGKGFIYNCVNISKYKQK